MCCPTLNAVLWPPAPHRHSCWPCADSSAPSRRESQACLWADWRLNFSFVLLPFSCRTPFWFSRGTNSDETFRSKSESFISFMRAAYAHDTQVIARVPRHSNHVAHMLDIMDKTFVKRMGQLETREAGWRELTQMRKEPIFQKGQETREDGDGKLPQPFVRNTGRRTIVCRWVCSG